MYFILKVKFVEGNVEHPRHKIVHESESLEDVLVSLEDIATKYIIKKHKPSFTENSDEIDQQKGKVEYETKYTMSRNKKDPNVIEIFEKVTKIETKNGWTGKIQEVTKSSKQIGYFCYVKYNFVVPPQTCDNCLMVINRPVPQKVPQTGDNTALLSELRNNELFQTLQENVENNRLDLSDDSTELIYSDEV